MKINGDSSRSAQKKQADAQVKPGYLRKASAAKYLGVSVRTLSDWMRMRLVAYIKPSNRVCLFKVIDLDSALNRFRRSAVGESGY